MTTGVTVTFDREFWRKLVDGALPSRQLEVDREALVRAIVECLSAWCVTNPNIGPLADRVRQIAAIFDQWQRATEKVGAALQEIGLEDAAGKYPPESDAFIIYMRAADGLRRWQRLYRPKDKEGYSAMLVKDLRRLCCGRDADDLEGGQRKEHGAGLSEPELETLLQRMVDSGRLPTLDIKGAVRRKDTGRTGVGSRMRSR